MISGCVLTRLSKLTFAYHSNRIIVFYPLNAILTIFGDALLDPLQAEVEQDIKLLEYTAGFIKWIRSDGYIPTDYLDISRMDSFV